MKNKLYKIMIALVMFGLAACQAGPAEGQATEFFEGAPGRGISVKPPAGWVAKLAGSSAAPFIVVTDDWPGYQKTNPNAFGIIILPVVDKGSAEDVLRISIRHFKDQELLTRQTSLTRLEQSNGQSYAWVEYLGKSVQESGGPAAYFFTAVTTEQRSVLIFTSVSIDKQEAIRAAYQSTVKAVTLH